MGPLLDRKTRWEIWIVFDFSTHKFDLYVDGLLMEAGVAWANAAAADFGQVVFLSGSAAPTTQYLDHLVCETAWASGLAPIFPGESTLVAADFTNQTGSGQDFTPQTDARNASPRVGRAASDPAMMVPTLAAAGLGTADGTKQGGLYFRGLGPNGIASATWKAASSGDIYLAIIVRAWEGIGPQTYQSEWYLFRYNGAAAVGQKLLLQGPDGSGVKTNLVLQDPTGVTISAGSSYTLKIALRGRYLYCYINDGSDHLQFTHKIVSNATGGGNCASEEFFGPYFAGGLAGNVNNSVCTAASFIGVVPSTDLTRTVGRVAYGLHGGTVPEWTHADFDTPAANLAWSKGLCQTMHRAGVEPSAGLALRSRLIYDLSNVAVVHQRGNLMSHQSTGGLGEVYLTLTRRGLWADDAVTAGVNADSGSQNIAPDSDWNARYFAGAYKVVDGAGAVTDLTDTGTVPHDWRNDLATQALPVGLQVLTSGTSKVRVTQVLRSNLNCTGSVHTVGEMYHASPGLSHAIGRLVANIVVGTKYVFGRGYLIEAGALALSDTVLQGWRADLATPATFTFVSGTLKTNAAGDLDADGFNERYGWYEINPAAGAFAFTLVVGGVTRYAPQFRLWSWTATLTGLTIDGVPAQRGVDYVIDDLGDGSALLQLLSNRASDTALVLRGAALLLHHHHSHAGTGTGA